MYTKTLRTILLLVLLLPVLNIHINASSQSSTHINLNAESSKYLLKLSDANSKQSIISELGKNVVTPITNRSNSEIDKWIEVKTNNTNILNQIATKHLVKEIVKEKERKLFSITPNDYYYGRTGDIQNGIDDQWNLKHINLKPVSTPSSNTSGWEVSTGSSNTIIAVIDTGIDLNHPDLVPNLWTNTKEIPGNGIDDDKNGYIDDIHGWNFAGNNNNVQDNLGHGTHVAGIIAASTNNSSGIAGACWSCRIMPLKVINDQGYGYDSDIATAIHYAVDNGAKVINMSLGGQGYAQILQDAVDYAWSHNVFIVSASGNDAASASDSYPGGLLDSFSIGSSDINDNTSSFSNTGTKLDIVAPGENILSTRLETLSGGSNCVTSSFYYCLTGTSMASPHVAGVAALIIDLHSSDNTWNVEKTRYALLKTASNSGSFLTANGFGLVNSLSALNFNTFDYNNSQPQATLQSLSSGYLKGTISLNGTANSNKLYQYIIRITNNNSGYIVKEVSGRSNVTNSVLYNLDTKTLSDGSYTLDMVVEDFSGIKTVSNSISLNVDNTPPQNVSLTSPANGQYLSNQTPIFTWSAGTDANLPITYDVYLDGNKIVNNTSQTYYTSSSLPEGPHTWYVVAWDNIGNFSTTLTNTFYVDITPPTINNLNVNVFGANAIISFTASDNISMISSYSISLDNGPFNNVSSPYTFSNLSDGNHVVTLKAYDYAENNSSQSQTFSINYRKTYLVARGDINGDGKVDISDLSILAQNWEKNTSSGDINGDGKVDISDLSILAQNWNKSF